jgi:hypothetical protein
MELLSAPNLVYSSTLKMKVVWFEGFTVATMKIAVFLDITPRGSCKNWRFGGIYRLHHHVEKNRRDRKDVSSN